MKRERIQINKIRNEREQIKTDSTEIQRIKKKKEIQRIIKKLL